jgi:integrase/recombinase XerC
MEACMAHNWTVTKDLFLTQEEVQRLYTALKDSKDLALQRKAFDCHIRDYYIIHVLFETGVRVFELTALKVSDFRSGSIIVRCGKGGKKRTILLTKETQRLLSEWIKVKAKVLHERTEPEDWMFTSERRKPYSTRGIRKRVKFWFGKVSIDSRLSCHSARHSYVSHLMAAGVDPVTIRDNAGHSSLAVTSLYSHAVKGDMGELQLYSSEKARKENC